MKQKIKRILIFLQIFYTCKIFSVNIGKTVFDIRKILIKEGNCIKHALFSPRDNIRKYIIELIKNETAGIKGAIYSFSDKHIMQELIKAKERNVKVEIILDSSNLCERPEKIISMHHNNLNIFVFNAPTLTHKKNKPKKSYLPLMHHKFLIFEKNICNKSILVTGSFNWTYSANLLNCENVTILDDDILLELYKIEFDNIKKNSTPLENYKTPLSKKVTIVKQDPNKVRDFKVSKL